MHHIFINNLDLKDKFLVINRDLEKDNFNHLHNSLRIKQNELVLLSPTYVASFDYLAKVVYVDSNSIKFEILEKCNPNELAVNINLYQGIIKVDKFEYVIEKAVELGVKKIYPVKFSYSVYDYQKKIDRFNKISKSASEQSRRHIIPIVYDEISFLGMIDSIKNNKYNILLYEKEDNISKTREYIKELKYSISKNDEINVIVGSEGGISKDEIDMINNYNIKKISLGKRILRAETATISIMSILTYELENLC